MKKQYLGDGVYVEVESGMLKLTTENGVSVTNTIYLEDTVWTALQRYVRALGVADGDGVSARRPVESPAPDAG